MLGKIYEIVLFQSSYLIIGYFLTHCQVFLGNFRYSLGFVSGYCVSGILPRFFATGKPLPQGYLFKMKIADVVPPRSGFVQQADEADSRLRRPSASSAGRYALTLKNYSRGVYELFPL